MSNPICALCKKAVPRVKLIKDELRKYCFVVYYCHGNRQIVRTTEQQLEDGVPPGVDSPFRATAVLMARRLGVALACMLAACGGVVAEPAPADCAIPSSFLQCGPQPATEHSIEIPDGLCYDNDRKTYWMFLAGGEAYHQSIGKGAATPTLCHIGVDGDATIGWHR